VIPPHILLRAGFITALLLSYIPEEPAFWMLLTLCETEPHRLADIFAPGLPLVQLLQYQLERLVEKFLPKLSAHFTAHGITPSMFSAQWLLTIFTYSFSFSVTCRIWDSFLLEGWKVVFRFAIVVLAHHEATLLAMDMEHILMFMPFVHEGLEADTLVAQAFRLNLKRKQLTLLREQFEAEHGPVVSPVQPMRSFKTRKSKVQQVAAATHAGQADGFSSDDSEGGQSHDSAEATSGGNSSSGAFQGAQADGRSKNAAHNSTTAAVNASRAAFTAGDAGGGSDPGHAPSRKMSRVDDLDAILVPGSPSVAEYAARARRASQDAKGDSSAGNEEGGPPFGGAGGVGDAPSPRRRASARSLLAVGGAAVQPSSLES
jgi:hypothetical protein